MVVSGTSQLLACGATNSPSLSPQDPKLVKAARDFESILIAQLWNSAKAGLGDDEDSGDAGAGTIRDMGVEAMSLGLAAHGGLGMGKMVLQQLENKTHTGS